ncbi:MULTISPECIES: HlyD family secretion protein [unclassified Shewanella]|uniref:HlyD family secretion protein n=1 Tax=unclassified Shewanella TaxID=196818 RepID=UPI000C85F49F|nr:MULTISPECIES: HlyD family secretion protein [unclassified Shewanella]MDO6620851.1 HlyD family secretion protein [Shewanella sp. 6_MG-2023]MDO6679430.1 HlyD family secretion protein [Shewanella sp. 4_MG-2023]PMG30383.1 multidrug transporter [Shewanella sp. 10N.286.52.C2]PMG51453.1 multidrug transporter [Shewanella sp. 10N.286.52.B9]PMH87980.1 multidrug transporter [Shewanella sp. 10N.286.48.B5]
MSAAEKSSRKLSFYIIGVILFVWLYSLWADRVTPMTGDARVHSYLVRVASQVAGNIVDVNVKNNQVVEAGEVLFKIDPRNYQIALQSAQANLAITGQSIGANTAAVEVAQANVIDALAARNNAKEQAVRITELAAQGVLSQSDLDNAIESRDRTQASYNAAEASLVQAKQNLGPQGENNPQLLAAMANLEQAQLDLQRTEVIAPSQGVVTNLQLTLGQRATVGTPMLTFIDPRGIWISALVRENSLEHIREGQRVEIVLDALPGRVLNGKVDSIGWGTGGSNNIDQATGFLTADTTSLNAQRYPVNIVFENDDIPQNIRYGSQATVAFFTEQSSFGEWLAKIWIRVVSVWTYVS